MKQKRIRKDGKPWHNNIGAWNDKLTAEQRKELAQKSARAQWGPVKEITEEGR